MQFVHHKDRRRNPLLAASARRGKILRSTVRNLKPSKWKIILQVSGLLRDADCRVGWQEAVPAGGVELKVRAGAAGCRSRRATQPCWRMQLAGMQPSEAVSES